MKKTTKKRARSPNTVMISLLQEIRKELIIERKTKLRNALLLATAIVMFAVPLNFFVEVGANYTHAAAVGEIEFIDLYSLYYWIGIASLLVVATALYKFYFPILKITIDQFDWKTALEDVSRIAKEDKYYIDPDGLVWICEGCDAEFDSERQADIHLETCEELMWICEGCDAKFDSERQADIHLETCEEVEG